MEPFGIGVVGIGDISRVYLNNLKNYPDIVRVVAVADANAQRAQDAAATHGIPGIYASAEELAADPAVDIVLCLTPPAGHAPVLLTALAAGKHGYTEKTLATTVSAGREVIETAQRSGLVVGCAPDTVLGGRVQIIRELIDAGRIGRITGGVATSLLPGLEWFHNSPAFYYGADVGPLMDVGPYYLSTLVTLLGPVRRVCGMSSRAHETRQATVGPMRGKLIQVESDTNVSALLEFDDSVQVTLMISFDVWDSSVPRLELFGTEGTVSMLDPDPLDGPNLFGGPVTLRTREEARYVGFPRLKNPPAAQDIPVNRRYSEVIHGVNSRGIGLVELA
ncbi:MAG: Gfo/Idh/MocA family oxidoreductase, partial [Propionibacteriaceae bacterium]|nr:Gfo/Idh/MocA family oxidoreductase [Propionibacteriaceae bacterium]